MFFSKKYQAHTTGMKSGPNLKPNLSPVRRGLLRYARARKREKATVIPWRLNLASLAAWSMLATQNNFTVSVEQEEARHGEQYPTIPVSQQSGSCWPLSKLSDERTQP